MKEDIIKKELEEGNYRMLTFYDPKNDLIDFFNPKNDVYYNHYLTILIGNESKKIIGLHIKEETTKKRSDLFYNVIDNSDEIWKQLKSNASLICHRENNIMGKLPFLSANLIDEEFSKFLNEVFELVFPKHSSIKPKKNIQKHSAFTDEEIEIIKEEDITKYRFGYGNPLSYSYYFIICVGNQSKRITFCEWHEGDASSGYTESKWALEDYSGMYELIGRKGIEYICEEKLGELEQALLPEELDKLKKTLIKGRKLNLYEPTKILPKNKQKSIFFNKKMTL